VVREGETGFLLDAGDPEELARDIEAGLDTDLTAVSDAGRTLVEGSYSFEAAVERYRDILQKLA
jgi:glycosyltransferase involved in cell wall biosynthesis